MNRRAVLVAAAVVLAAAGAALSRRPAPRRGPVLLVSPPSSTPIPPTLPIVTLSPSGSSSASISVPESHEDRAMALAVITMSPAERRQLLELMTFAAARLESRLTPLGTDLDEGDPVDQLRRSLGPHLPRFTAARALERGAWTSADLEVRVSASCANAEPARHETCIPLWDDTHDPEPEIGRRARFLAWAATRMAVVDVGTHERAVATAEALRARAVAEGSPIGLVLDEDSLWLTTSSERDELRTAADRLGRAMAASGVRDAKDLEAFARTPTVDRIAPWLVLSKSELAIVPRLSAIAQPAALVRAIEEAAGAGPVRWVHHP